MDLNLLRLEAIIEGFINAIHIYNTTQFYIYNTNKQVMYTQGAPVTNMVFV